MNSPRRVALVIGQLTRGGAEGQLVEVVRHLDRTRYEPLVYCLSAATEPLGAQVAATGAPLRSLRGNVMSRVRQLVAQLAADRVDLLHAWLYLANAFAGVAHVLQPSRPLITSARNCKVQGWAANVLGFRASRAIVANSRDVATFIERRYWAPPQRVRVIYNGIDVERFHPSPRAADDLGPIITVGRLTEQKNHRLFLQAAAQLARDMPGLRFVVVGDGPRRAELERLAQELAIVDRVLFAGQRADVDALLRSASLFWLTSRWEGMPNVVLEAMASGVPVIATDVGGVRELVRSGSDGFVVGAAEPAAFVQRSRELLADGERRRQFASAARTHAEEFATTRMVATLAQLYDDVLGGVA